MATSATETRRILVVEDEADLATVFDLWLQERYEVDVLASGNEAIAALDDTIDVVFLDRRMSDGSGEQVLAELQTRDLPCQVVIVSAMSPDVLLLDYDYALYLTKPVGMDDLEAAIDLLDARRDLEPALRAFLDRVEAFGALLASAHPRRLARDDAYLVHAADLVEDAETFDDRLAGMGDAEHDRLLSTAGQTALTALRDHTLPGGRA